MLISTHEISCLVLSPALLRKGSKRAAGRVSGSQPKATPPKCILLYVGTVNVLIQPDTCCVIPHNVRLFLY